MSKIPKQRQLIEEKLINSGNERYIANIIINFIGKECDKCKSICDYPLTHVMSFNRKGNYKFHDLPGANYKLKKFCQKCCYSRASSAPIYIEVHDSNLVYPNY